MNRQINNRIKIFIASVVVLIVIIISFSFAYIRGDTVGSESISTVALTGGNITVRYTNNSSDIIATDIVPDYEVTKSFTITSDFGDRDYYKSGVWYTVAIVLDKNDFDDNSIVYSISADNTSSSDGLLIPNRENIGIPNSTNSNSVIVGSGKLNSNNVSHTYNLKISYPYRKSNQSNEIGCEFKAHIDIISSEFIKATFDMDGGSFNDLDLNNNSLSIPANSIVSIPVPNKDGYIFAGWQIISGNCVTDITTISTLQEDITLKALFNLVYEFDYTGGEQQFIAEVPGYYKIETWGAQGGVYNPIDHSRAGYGGYSVGTILLTAQEKLYVNVGGNGVGGADSVNGYGIVIEGAYNGGGNARTWIDNKTVGSGGGATHISITSGILSSLSSNIDDILIVSGGGGGTASGAVQYYSGDGGGYIGNSGYAGGNSWFGSGGSQTAGGSKSVEGGITGNSAGFGQGGYAYYHSVSTSAYGNSSGGGGGFYGGGPGLGAGGYGGGGSGYIGNSLLADKYMYCYNCATSNVESTKTYTTTCAEETPTENCAKIGNGYARITYLHS